jgi:hypothetical protein
MRRGPLGGEIDAIASALTRTGYTRLSARRYLSLMASFSLWGAQIRNAPFRVARRPSSARCLCVE